MPEMHEPKTYAVFEHSRNKKLIAELEKSGASVIKIPPAELIKIELAESSDQLEEIITFDWLIFADIYAAEFFLELLRQNDFDLFELDNLRICALGEAIAERLRFVQIHTDVIPVVNETDKIVDAIKNYIYEENKFASVRLLIVKGASERLELIAALEEKGAEAREMVIYRAEFALPNGLPKIKALVKGGAIDEIIFTMPEDFLHCQFIFFNEDIAEVLRHVKISAISEAVRQTLFENQISATLFLQG